IAPAIRKVQKIAPSETCWAAPASAGALALFMMLDRLAASAVHERGLGGAQRNPVAGVELDRLEKFLRQLARLAMERGQAFELELVAELADHVAPGRAVAPYRDRGLAPSLVPEVQLAEVDQALVHHDVIDQGERRLGIGRAHALERRKDLRNDLEALGEDHVGGVELAAVGVQRAHSAQRVAEL